MNHDAQRVRGLGARFGPAGVLVLLVLVPGAIWLALDHSVWPWDPAWYGQTAVDLFLDLTRQPDAWPRAMAGTLGIKAPALCWLGQFCVPLHALFGSVDAALIALVLAVSAAAAALMFVSLRAVAPLGAAWLAGLVLVSAPLSVGLSHQFFVEPLQMLTVCWFVRVAIAPSSRRSLLLDLVTGTAFGLLVKTTTPAYVVAVGLLVLLRIVRWRPADTVAAGAPRLGWRLALSALVTSACAIWYTVNGASVIEFVRSAASGKIASFYGKEGTLAQKLWFWLDQGSLAFFASAWFGIGWALLAAWAGVKRWRRGRGVDGLDVLALVSVLQLGLCLVMFATQVNEETRYLLPVLPYLAVLTAFVVREGGRVATVPLSVMFAVQLGLVHGLCLGAIDSFGPTTPWLSACQRDDFAARRIEALVGLTGTPAAGNAYTIVGIETAAFNANTASYRESVHRLRTGSRYRCYYTSLGYAETDPERAWRRLEELEPVFLAFLRDVEPMADPLNAVTAAIHARVRASDRFEAVGLPGFPDVLLYRARAGR